MLIDGGQSMRMKSYSPMTGASALPSLISRPISCSSLTSASVRSSLPGKTAKPPSGADMMVSAAVASPSRTSQAEFSSSILLMPQPMVALPCGSTSTSSTRRCVAASEAARLTQVVVLPTPPFWFATAMIRAIGLVVLHQHDVPGAFLEPRYVEFLHTIVPSIGDLS